MKSEPTHNEPYYYQHLHTFEYKTGIGSSSS